LTVKLDNILPLIRRPFRLSVLLGAAAMLGCQSGPTVVTLPPPEVTVSQPVAREVGDYFVTTGQVAAVESVDVRARVSGYLFGVHFEDGTEVKQGDLLFEIDPRPYQATLEQAEADLARWEAERRKAEADVVRTQKLLPRGAASERDLEVAIAAKETAIASIKAAKASIDQANLNLEWARVIAPISGRVSRASITKGNLIQLSGSSSDVLTTLVSMDPMYVYFDIDEATVLERQAANRAAGRPSRPDRVKDLNLSVEIALGGHGAFEIKGPLDFVDNRVDPSTGTLKARAVFDNAERLLTPGLFVRVRVQINELKPSLLVPERAIGTDQGTKYLLVVDEQNRVEYRPVELGPLTDDGFRAVRKGLQAEDWVIVNGVQRARPGASVNPQRVPAAS
jgi:RND family efflux transporter MFP subunit